jgi:hypothetical protein
MGAILGLDDFAHLTFLEGIGSHPKLAHPTPFAPRFEKATARLRARLLRDLACHRGKGFTVPDSL